MLLFSAMEVMHAVLKNENSNKHISKLFQRFLMIPSLIDTLKDIKIPNIQQMETSFFLLAVIQVYK